MEVSAVLCLAGSRVRCVVDGVCRWLMEGKMENAAAPSSLMLRGDNGES